MHRCAVRLEWLLPALVTVTALLGACTPFPSRSAGGDPEVPLVSPYALWVGACFDDDQDLRGDLIEVTSCARPHDNEVFAVILEPGEPGAMFPGNKHMETVANRGCLAAFQPYVGIDYESSRFIWASLTPDEWSWDELDDRKVICLLFDAEYEAHVGTARGSRE